MRVFRRLLATAAVPLVALQGCAILSFEELVTTDFAVLKSYEIGRVQSATVGDAIVRVQQARRVPTFITLYDWQPDFLSLRIPARTPFVAVMENGAGDLMLSNPLYDRQGVFVVSADASRVRWIATGDPASHPRPVSNEPQIFDRIDSAGDRPGDFTAEIIYSGLAGGIARAVYREYVDNLARPAFSQDLQYDLAADSLIAFRSIKIRVLEATNTLLRFQVEDDGGLPWLPVPRPGARPVSAP